MQHQNMVNRNRRCNRLILFFNTKKKRRVLMISPIQRNAKKSDNFNILLKIANYFFLYIFWMCFIVTERFIVEVRLRISKPTKRSFLNVGCHLTEIICAWKRIFIGKFCAGIHFGVECRGATVTFVFRQLNWAKQNKKKINNFFFHSMKLDKPRDWKWIFTNTLKSCSFIGNNYTINRIYRVINSLTQSNNYHHLLLPSIWILVCLLYTRHHHMV